MRHFNVVAIAFFLSCCGETTPEGYCADLVRTAAKDKAIYLSIQSDFLKVATNTPDQGLSLMDALNYSEATFERSRREVFDVCGSDGERFINERYEEVHKGKM